MNPFDSFYCYVALKPYLSGWRGIANAMHIASFLKAHDSIEKVIYSGLESHPQYEIAKTNEWLWGNDIY